MLQKHEQKCCISKKSKQSKKSKLKAGKLKLHDEMSQSLYNRCSQMRFWELEYVVASCQKLGIILENKIIYKLISSKNVNKKKSAPKFVHILWWKKIRKIRMLFDVENWLWKSDFGTFWHLLITPITKFNDFIRLQLIFSQKPF